MSYADVQGMARLFQHPWDVGALLALDKEALRYSELGVKLTEWSGERPGDSALTRTVKRLVVGGFITVDGGLYRLTAKGSRRLAQIHTLIEALHSVDLDATADPDATEPMAHPGDTVLDHVATTIEPSRTDPDRRGAPGPEDRVRTPRTTGMPMADETSSLDSKQATKMETSVPHSARIWNYWLGGKDNFAADREVGDQVRNVFPDIVKNARASRAFLVRAVSYLAGEAGIRQFLDIGTGLPTANNTHEVAQNIAPESRIVYVDNDPLVLVHARALLTSTPEGATDYIDGDVREPEKILQEAARTLDFGQPIALMMLGILGNVPDTDEARTMVKRLVDGVPPGSYLVINDGADTNDANVEAARVSSEAGYPYCLRSPALIARFFDGLELVEPGVVSTPLWRPEPGEPAAELAVFCGMGRKPLHNQ